MTTKHTPGPWRITDDFISVWTDNGPDKDDFQIASLDSEGAPEIDGPTSTANAYLIAAAPDLLAAAEFVFQYYLENIGIGNPRAKMLQAAINKAKGE